MHRQWTKYTSFIAKCNFCSSFLLHVSWLQQHIKWSAGNFFTFQIHQEKNTLEWKRKSRFSGCYKSVTILCQTQKHTLIRLLLTYAGVFIHTHSQEYHVQRAYQGKGMACLQAVLARHKARETQESNNEKEVKCGLFFPPTSVLRKTFFYFRVRFCQCFLLFAYVC